MWHWERYTDVSTAPCLSRAVAIKTISPELLADTELRRRFFYEAKAAAALSHPNHFAHAYQIDEAYRHSFYCDGVRRRAFLAHSHSFLGRWHSKRSHQL